MEGADPTPGPLDRVLFSGEWRGFTRLDGEVCRVVIEDESRKRTPCQGSQKA